MKYKEAIGSGCALFTLLLLGGCGSSTSTAPVNGTVNYNGAPLKEGTITFIPQEGTPAYGKIVDGVITDLDTDGNKGAPVGKNKITVQAVSGGNDMYAPKKSLVPDKYGDPEKSGLTAEIVAGKENKVEFDLK